MKARVHPIGFLDSIQFRNYLLFHMKCTDLRLFSVSAVQRETMQICLNVHTHTHTQRERERERDARAKCIEATRATDGSVVVQNKKSLS